MTRPPAALRRGRVGDGGHLPAGRPEPVSGGAHRHRPWAHGGRRCDESAGVPATREPGRATRPAGPTRGRAVTQHEAKAWRPKRDRRRDTIASLVPLGGPTSVDAVKRGGVCSGARLASRLAAEPHAETRPRHVPPDTLTSASATSLAHAIRAARSRPPRSLTPTLRRIDAVNPILNAVVQLMTEPARQRPGGGRGAGGRAAVGAVARRPVHDQGLDRRGRRAVHRRHAGACPPGAGRDATVVARLKAAGGILLGKTNVVIDNAVYGRTNNPYNPAYSPAGSSSGEAALIAAGGSPFGLGSDSGGSIRQPAHCCGIAGLKRQRPRAAHRPLLPTSAR